MNENTKLIAQIAATVVVSVLAANVTRAVLVVGARRLARKLETSK